MGLSVFPVPSSATTVTTLPAGAPPGLTLRYTLSTTATGLTYDGNPSYVYAIIAGGGRAGGANGSSTIFGPNGGGAGAVFSGWMTPSTSVTIGAGGVSSAGLGLSLIHI